MDCSRRIFCMALPALVGLPAFAAQQAPTLPSKIYNFDELPSHQIKTVLSRAMFTGKLYEGCEISLHESDLEPNSVPHLPHKHRHEEMVLVVEGVLEFTINGKPTRADAGSVLFAGSNELHGIRNPTAEHAKYFVLALGAGKD
jgi:quercetin dioxygenase-like cupin family protein